MNYSTGTVSIMLGNGDGSFGAPHTYFVGSNPLALVAGDFNGDGRLDLAVADGGSNEVAILLGNGDGTFRPAVFYPAGDGPCAVVAGDFNGDGKLDLAVADTGNYANDPGGVSILLGNGDGTFQPPVEYAAGNEPDALVAGDFNGDGKVDLAVADYGTVDFAGGTDPGGGSLLLGNGDGTFQAPERSPREMSPSRWWPGISPEMAGSIWRWTITITTDSRHTPA